MTLFDFQRFIDKIKNSVPIDDVIDMLEKLPSDPTFRHISENAGTIGGAIKITLHVTDKVYRAKVPVKKLLSLALIRIMVESAKDSIPYSVSNFKIDEIFSKESNSEEFEDIVLELFDSRDNTDEGMIDYLPYHPVFIRFGNLLKDAINSYNQKYEANINIQKLLTEFNSNLLIKLEEEKSRNNDLRNLLQKWKVNADFHKLSHYLTNARKMFLEQYEIDGKSLSEYYVENQAYIVEKKSWEREEENIKRKQAWNLDSFLASDESLAIIAAPFGIGKSSLAKKMAHDCAAQFIENPTSPNTYIPIYAPLEWALEKTCNNNSLVMNVIYSSSSSA